MAFEYDADGGPITSAGGFHYDEDGNPIRPGGKEPAGGFMASVKQTIGAGIRGAGQAASDFIPGVESDNALKRYGQEVIDANPTAVRSFGDIGRMPGTAVAEATGNAAGSMAGIVGSRALGMGITAAAPLTGPFAPATALLGRAIAWFGPAAMAALPSYGGIRDKQILNDPNNEADAKSKAIAALGAATVGAIESKFGPQQWALSALTKEGRAALAEKFAETTLAKGIGFGALKGAAVEGAEELVQNPIEQIASYDDPTTKESLADTAFSGAMGAIGGGVFGGATGGFVGRRGEAKKPEEKPAAPLLLGNTPDPIIVFPDGTAGRRSDLDAYINGLPEDQQVAARAKLMGMGARDATPEDILKAPDADSAIATFAASLTGTDMGALMGQENPLIGASRDMQAQAAADQADLADLAQSEARDLNTMRAMAVEAAATVEAPTALQLAMQRAQAKAAPATNAPAPSIPAIPGDSPGNQGTAQVVTVTTPDRQPDILPGDISRDDGKPFQTESGARLKQRYSGGIDGSDIVQVQGGYVVRPKATPTDPVAAAPGQAAGMQPAASRVPGTVDPAQQGLPALNPSTNGEPADAQAAQAVQSPPQRQEPTARAAPVPAPVPDPVQPAEGSTVPAQAQTDPRLIPVSKRGEPAVDAALPEDPRLIPVSKRKSAGASNLRKAGYARNPLLAFLATHGLRHKAGDSKSLKTEFSPDKQIMVMGHGPVFRQNGRQLDEILPLAIQDGYLPPGSDETDLANLIASAIRGDRVAPMFTEDGAEQAAALRDQRDREDYERKQAEVFADLDRQASEELEGALADLTDAEFSTLRAELLDGPVADIDAESNTDIRSAMKALGFTDQEIDDATAQGQGAPGQDGAGRSGPAEAAGQGQGEGAQQGVDATAEGSPDREGLSAPIAPGATSVVRQKIVKRPPGRREESSPWGRFATGEYIVSVQQFDGGPATTLHVVRRTGEMVSVEAAPSEMLETGSFGYLRDAATELFSQQQINAEAVLTTPTRADVIAQQDRAENAQALDDKAQIDREAEGFQLQAQTVDTRTDTTGDMFGGPSVDDYQQDMARRRKPGTEPQGPSLFDQPAEPEPAAPATNRFEAGQALTKEQRKAVLASLVDVYKAKGAPREQKGIGADGNERYGYVHSPELFEKSDITGAMVRYYVTLPDGRIAHPSELFPDYTQADIDAAMAKNAADERNDADSQRRVEANAEQFSKPSAAEADADWVRRNPGPNALVDWRTNKRYSLVPMTKDGKFYSVRDDDTALMKRLERAGWVRADAAGNQAEPAAQATAILDAANVTGKDRLDILKDVKSGALTPDEVQAAFPGVENPPEPAPKPGEVDNFGEALPPARRNMAAKLDEELSDSDIANRPLSEIWPLAENQAIEDTFAAAVAHAARAEVPSKPRVAYKLKQWVQKVKTVRELAAMIVSGRFTREQFIAKVPASLKDWMTKVMLLEQIPRDQWNRVEAVEARPDSFGYKDGQQVRMPHLSIRIDGKSHWLTGDAGIDGDVRGTLIGNMQGIRALLAAAEPEERMQFEIRQRRGGKVFINKKGDSEYRALMEFDVVADARKAINEQYAELVAAWEATKARDNITERDLRSAENRPRAGKDHRDGRDVTPEEFQTKFGFRGGEFGKWVKQGKGDKERQAILNSAYDALMDLASIAGIPPRAISLNGTLGIAFGSRGSGWASAHFEPGNLVMNLTKTRGAGALAHEWFHALDNYFSRMRRGGEEDRNFSSAKQYNDQNFITHRPEPMMVPKNVLGGRYLAPMTLGKLQAMHEARKDKTDAYNPDNWQRDPKTPEGVRPEVEARFAALVDELNKSPMTKRAMLLDGVKSGEGYWSRTLERAARAFESYVIAKMHEEGYHNDFLVNVRKSDETGKAGDRYPYLLAGEVKPIAEAFDALFDALETAEDDAGNVAIREPDAPYETDLFGQPVPTPAGRPAPARPTSTRIRRDAQPAAGVQDTPAPAGEYFASTIVGSEVSRELGASRITKPEHAAQATTYLYKSAVERLDGIVTDANGKPLGIVGGFKGALAQASVYPATLMAEAVRIPGAARIWFSHNHPSGNPQLSRADENLNQVLTDVFRGSGIEPMGLLAIGDGRFSHVGNSSGGMISNEQIPAPTSRVSVPVIERTLAPNGITGTTISSPQAAKQVARDFYDRAKQPGLMLLNSQNGVIGWVPITDQMKGELRGTGGLNAVYRAISESNAGAAIIVHGGELTHQSIPKRFPQVTPSENIAAALSRIDVRPLDSIEIRPTSTKSAAEIGMSIADGPVFARGNPFYSALSREIEGINAKAMTPGDWGIRITGLIKAGKVKADEVEWSGLSEFLKLQTGKVTKEQVTQFLDANGVKVEETVLAGPGLFRDVDEAIDYVAERYAMTPEEVREEYGYADEQDYIELARSIVDDKPDQTKYGRYQLPGGTNYREVLLTLPTQAYRYKGKLRDLSALTSAERVRFKDMSGFAEDGNFKDAAELDEWQALFKKTKDAPEGFKSGHWDEPNILAHIRVNDRTDADGRRVLFIEEIQSDWGQQGKKQGFKPGAAGQRRFQELGAEWDSLARIALGPSLTEDAIKAREQARQRQAQISDEMNAISDAERDGLPGGPFVTKTDAWLSLALKRIVKMAVDEGYDRVAFINGEQSAERYSLDKLMNSITAYKRKNGNFNLEGFDVEGRKVDIAWDIEPAKIDDYIGKELAKKIDADLKEADRSKTYSGGSLKVEAKGMRAFYDQIVPSVLKDVLRKVGGGAVETVGIDAAPRFDKTPDELMVRINETSDGRFRVGVGAGDERVAKTLPTRAEAEAWAAEQQTLARRRDTLPQPGFTITPAMRERAAGGLPMFDRNADIAQLEALLRAVAPGRSETAASVRDMVSPLSDKWNIPVTVVQRPDQLPVPAPSDARGMYYNGAIYLVASNLNSRATVMRTLGHEAIAHHGLREMLGDDGFSAMMRQINLAVKAGNPAMRKISEYVRRTYVDKNGKFELTPEQEADEIAARAVEDGIDPESGEFRPGFGWLKGVFARVVQFLRDLGITVPMSNTELQGVLVNSMRGLEAGAKLQGQNSVMAAARKGNQTDSAETAPVVNAPENSMAVRNLNAVMRGAGWEVEYVDIDLTAENPKAAIRVNRNDGRFLIAKVDAQGRASFETFQRERSLRMDPGQKGRRPLSPMVDDTFLGRQRFEGARSMLRGMTNYLADNALNPTALSDMRSAWAGVMTGPVKQDAALPAPAFDPKNPDIRFARANQPSDIDRAWRDLSGMNKLTDYDSTPETKVTGTMDEFVLSREKGKQWAALNVREFRKDDGEVVYSSSLEVGSEEFPRGTGAATTMYLQALNIAKQRGMGWMSEGVRSDAAQAIYRRLTEAGVPFKEVDGSSYVDAASLKSVDLAAVARKLAGDRPMPAFARSAVTGKTITPTWQAPDPTRMDDLLYSMQDKHIDTKRVVTAVRDAIGGIADNLDPYLQEELYHGRAAMATKEFLEKSIRPLLTDMQARGVEMSDFEEYLHNRHAERRNIQVAKVNPSMPDGGSGIKTADARAYLAGLPAAKRTAYQALAKRVDQMNRDTRALLVSSGLEKQSTIDAWQAAYGDEYVPLMREEMDNGTTGIGQGFSVRGSSSKRAMGSNRPVANILANIALQREKAITRAEKRRIGEALYGMVLSAPNPDFWFAIDPALEQTPAQITATSMQLISMGLNPIDAEAIAREPRQRYIDPRTGQVAERINPVLRSADNVLAVRIDGEDKYVFFNAQDPRAMRMAKSLKNLDSDQLGVVMGNVAKMTRYFASINTQFNPVFGVVNLTRDIQTALLNLQSTSLAGKQADVMKHVGSALRGIYIDLRDHRAGKQPTSTWAGLFEEFQREGGATGYRDMYANAQERADAITDELKKIKQGKALEIGRGIFGWLSDYNESMENAVRLATYKVAKEQGMSNQQAASIAKNLTVNFNRKGQVALQAGALYAFFNAAVQGSTRMAQTMFESGKVGKLSGLGKKIMTGGLLLGSMQALLLAAAGYDDEEPPDFVRERSLVLPIGGDKYVSIPMPLGFHVIPNLARIPTEWAMGGFRDTPKRLAQLVGLFADAFNPIGSAGMSLQTLAPTIIDPLAALAENRDWTGKPIAKKDFNSMQPTAGHTRAKDTATPWARAIAYGVNWVTGGTDYKPGMASPTPDQIDYLIGQATGGVGREVSKLSQVAGSTMSGEELPLYKIPLLGRFVGTTAGQAAESGRFYENLKQIGEHDAELSGLKKDRRMAEYQEYLRDNPQARLVPIADRTYREVSKLIRMKRDAIKAGASSERVKMLDQQITSRMRQFNERIARMQEPVT